MYNDIYQRARTDDVFFDTVNTHCATIARYGNMRDSTSVARTQAAFAEVYKLCDYNSGYLVPWFFPNYPKDKPLSLTARPFAFSMLAFITHGYLAIEAARQVSKCRFKGAKETMFRPDGRPVSIEEIQEGDWVLTLNSRGEQTPACVKAKHEVGVLSTRKLALANGVRLHLSDEHMLRTLNGWKKVKDLRPGDYVAEARAAGFFAGTPAPSPLLFEISAMSRYLKMSGGKQACRKLTCADAPGWVRRRLGKFFIGAPEISAEIQPTVCRLLNSTRLPSWVFSLSAEDTSKYLGLLWAGDNGGLNIPEAVDFKSKSRLRDVRAIFMKMGVETHVDNTTLRVPRGAATNALRRIVIGALKDAPALPHGSSGSDDFLPGPELVTHLLAKGVLKSGHHAKALAKCTTRSDLMRLNFPEAEAALNAAIREHAESAAAYVRVRSNKRSLELPCWDVEIDTHNSYLLDQVVSHNSTTLVARQLINQYMFPNWKSLYIAPHSQHAETYAKKMAEMQKSFRYFRRDSSLRQNLYFSETHRGSTIDIDNVMMTASHIHGRTADEVLFDEYQFFNADFENEILEVQSSRDMKVRIYAGTAFTVDSPLHERYADSTAAAWHVRSPGGYINFGDKDQVLKTLSPDGLRCPKTRFKLDVTDGLWVEANPSRIEDRKYGFHIPKLIIPSFVDDIIQYAEIYSKFVSGDINDFLKSTCGICVDTAGREITKQDLVNMCCDKTRKEMCNDARKGVYRYIISGADWGGSEYDPVNRIKVSFSFHTVLGFRNDGSADIIHQKRYSGQAYEEVAADMAKYHNALKGFAFGSDSGAGMGYNKELRKYIHPQRHLIMTLTGPGTAPVAPITGLPMSAMVGLNKTEAITAVYSAIKHRPSPRLRCYKYAESSDFLADFMNSFRVLTDNQHGKRYFKYIRPASKSDDGLMSCMFAYATGRLVMGEPLIADPAFAEALRRIFVAGDIFKHTYDTGSPGSMTVSG